MQRYTGFYLTIPLLIITGFLFNSISANNSIQGPIIQLSVEEAIGPATDDYIKRALETATESNAEIVIIQMDTPGGLDSAMRAIIKNIAGSTVPVATYVAPTGARAASAGTYILYASHIAAMAPGTNLGAATPVKIGGISPPAPAKPIPAKPTTADSEKDRQGRDDPAMGEPGGDANGDVNGDVNERAMHNKLINDAVAYIRGLAELRGRNQEWAEKAVRQAASLYNRPAAYKN